MYILDLDQAWVPKDSGEVNIKVDAINWSFVDLRPDENVEQVEMLNLNFGAAVGENDQFWIYDNGVWSFTGEITGSEDIYGVWVENEFSMWLSTTNGKIYRGHVTSTDAILTELGF